MKRITDIGTIDIFNYVQSMRHRRCFMVQTEVRERERERERRYLLSLVLESTGCVSLTTRGSGGTAHTYSVRHSQYS